MVEDPSSLIRSAIDSGNRALSEFDSKKLLAHFGVDITSEGLAVSADQAVELAAKLGPAVAMKACSAELMHKSEAGAVRLGLRDPEAIRQTFDELMAIQDGLDGVLIQEMAAGNRELVLGLSRDPQFGPCVMLGLGGIFAEVIADTAFRAAPLDMVEARDMCEQLSSKAIFGAFRGQEPVDMDALCRALVALGRIGIELPQVAEIDVNPVIIDRQGGIKAVDALVVLGEADNV